MAKTKYVYYFGDGDAEGDETMRPLLGGKGANLAQMAKAPLSLPVPSGFTISIDVCQEYYKLGKKYPAGLDAEVAKYLNRLEKSMGKKLGDEKDPLLVSVRSGAAESMPGMMDTILNLGLNDKSVLGLANKTNNPRFAWDAYRRFIQMFGNVAMGVDHDKFEAIIEEVKSHRGIKEDTELKTEELQEIVTKYKAMYKREKGEDFPQDPQKQLWGAIGAVFGSWMNPRAITYRKINNIDERVIKGTAVTVMAMVFGNMGDTSGTGVAFSRDPSTGENHFMAEYLINAQGEDVVAGIRTPQQITKAGSQKWAKENNISEAKRKSEYPSLEESMPEVYKQLVDVYKKLEAHYRDMQDMEFTIQGGKLWMLQTRNGKRTAPAAVKMAVDMVKEGLITKEMAVGRIEPKSLDQLLHPIFDPKAPKKVLTKGLAASPGAGCGRIVFSAEDAGEWKAKGEKVILVRIETSPEDVAGMDAAEGILTQRGGMTSHAAVVARGWGKCCVSGCSDIEIDYKKATLKIGNTVMKQGDWISLNGSTGEVMFGKVPTVEPSLAGDFGQIMKWADEIRQIDVRTNADSPKDAKVARKFGAQGIGLCRTEHMFFDGERIKHIREMILADDVEGREKALKKLLKFQTDDFTGIFEAMNGYPVTIRTLDPPLHEFVPNEPENQAIMAKEMKISVEKVKAKVDSLHEANPMLGHRGCRLGVTYPEITRMQATAIFTAACELTKKGLVVLPEVMIPLVGTVQELRNQKAIVKDVAETLIKKYKVEGKLHYKIGTMIEIPRAAITANQIATEAEFFSFGTNDLTQMTFGYSRDDIASFVPEYLNKKILKNDPFQVLDQEGVGQLVRWGVERGRSVRPDLKVGICGEHGGEPSSVKFCHRLGFDYVSCSPFRVPIARLAAAQAAIEHGSERAENLKLQNHTPIRAKASEIEE